MLFKNVFTTYTPENKVNNLITKYLSFCKGIDEYINKRSAYTFRDYS